MGQLLEDIGVHSRWAYVVGPAADRMAAATEQDLHRLAASRTSSMWRRPLLTAASFVVPTAPRARLAARFDPWLRKEARRSSVVVALDGIGELIGAVATEFNQEVEVHRGGGGLRAFTQDVLCSVLERRVRDAFGTTGGPSSALVEEILEVFRVADELRTNLPGLELPTSPSLRLLPARVRDRGTLTRLVAGLGAAGVLPGPVATAYLARAELDTIGRTNHQPGTLGAEVLDEVARSAGQDARLEAEWVSLALEVVFHRELHSDSVDSPLVTDPDAYLAPLRATKVWRQLLIDAVPDSGEGNASDGPRDVPAPQSDLPPWQPDLPHRLQVLMLPGAYGTFQAPVEACLRELPAVRVRTWRRQDMPGHLRTMGVTRTLVRQRLAAARGEAVPKVPEDLARLLVDQPTDVVFIDWADKGAVLATLLAPRATRIVLRLHGVDALRPWIHLLDWSRVDTLVCVSEPLRRAVLSIVGERARAVPSLVVPNLVNLERFGAAAEDGDSEARTLCVVGWAQRVKDPLWAVEVLAGLLEHGGDWKLLLVGADFPEQLTASGTAYAERFRARAMADDVRDRIEYTGYVRDLPPVLARAGVVLSSSLRESWPLGMAEAVAAGALPVVRDWPMWSPYGGARAVWPQDWVVDDVEGAVDRILRHVEDPPPPGRSTPRAELAELADPERITGRLRAVVAGPVGRLGHLTSAGQHDEAEALAREVFAATDPPQPLLHQAAASAGRAGELTLRRDLLRRWSHEHPHPYVAYQLRQQEGVLRELDPAWRPRLSPELPRPSAVGDRGPKVLHVLKVSLPYRQSGYAMRSLYLLREQARAGRDVVAVTALDFPPATDEVPAPAEEMVGEVRHVRLLRDEVPEREPADDRLQAFASALETVVAQERPSVIHVHSGHRGYDLAVVALAVGEAAGIPVVYEVRGFFEAVWTRATHRAEDAEIYGLRGAVEACCLHRASAVVTLSESMRKDILDRTRPDGADGFLPAVRPEDVFVVPNAVDLDIVEPRERRPDLVEQLHLTNRFVFGYISNLDHAREGQEILVEAVRGLRWSGLDATALIVGDGARRAELEELAVRLGVAEHVVFTGQVPHEQVGDYYALLDVFVVPRVDERAARLVTPLKPYEAMAMGLPVVVSDLPALQEIVGDDERGVSFTAGDANALQRVLLELARDAERRRALGDAGRRWVEEHRTWTAVARGYDQAYSRALGADAG